METEPTQQAIAHPEDTSPNNFSRQTSPTIGKVAMALAKAQGAFHPLVRNCEGKVTYEGKDGKPGGSYVFAYADLSAVVDATKDALAANELAIVNIVNAKAGTLRVALIHSSNEWIASDFLIPSPTQVGPQRFGTALTYLKRYGLSGLLGVAADDDDDANSAEGNQFQKTERPKQPPKQPSEKATKVNALATALGQAGISEPLAWVSKELGRAIASSEQITDGELESLLTIARAKKAVPK
jgi:hypothetical protein